MQNRKSYERAFHSRCNRPKLLKFVKEDLNQVSFFILIVGAFPRVFGILLGGNAVGATFRLNILSNIMFVSSVLRIKRLDGHPLKIRGIEDVFAVPITAPYDFPRIFHVPRRHFDLFFEDLSLIRCTSDQRATGIAGAPTGGYGDSLTIRVGHKGWSVLVGNIE